MEWALHLANILILCSFLVRKIIILRMLSICAGIFFATYFLSQNPPMTAPVGWNALFALVNISQIILLWYQQRKIPLSPEELFLQEHFFSSLNPSEIRDLFQSAKKESFAPGTQILSEDRPTMSLLVILSGEVQFKSLTSDQRYLPGQFIGVPAYLSGKETTADVVAATSATCLEWGRDSLNQWSSSTPNRHTMLLSALSKDLLKKLKHSENAKIQSAAN